MRGRMEVQHHQEVGCKLFFLDGLVALPYAPVFIIQWFLIIMKAAQCKNLQYGLDQNLCLRIQQHSLRLDQLNNIIIP